MAFRISQMSFLVANSPKEARAKLEAELRKHAGDVRKTAQALGASRGSVYNWMQKLGVQQGVGR